MSDCPLEEPQSQGGPWGFCPPSLGVCTEQREAALVLPALLSQADLQGRAPSPHSPALDPRGLSAKGIVWKGCAMKFGGRKVSGTRRGPGQLIPADSRDTHQEGAEEEGEEHFAASVSPAPPAAA